MIWENKKVVVTGGAGFIGINLVQYLCQLGAQVHVIDLPRKDTSILPTDVKIIKGDILDKALVEENLIDADYVFHLAARTDLDGKTIDSYRVNFEGTSTIIDALQLNNRIQKLILFSTQLVVGLFDEKRFIDENEPYRTKTLYGQSKILAEKMVLEKCPKYGIPFAILRPTSVYGPHGKVPYRDMFLTIKNHRYFHIGKANNLISMAYVKNIVEQAVFLATTFTSDTIFFGNDIYPYTMKEFADAVAHYFGYKIPTIPDVVAYMGAEFLGIFKALGFQVPLYPFRLRNIKTNYCYTIGKLIKLGYFPRYGLLDGIKETLDWYMKHDLDFND